MIFDLFKVKKDNKQCKMKLVYDRSQPLTKTGVINYLRSLNIEVHTNTKARGNNGIYMKNRIDVQRGLSEEKAVEVLIHEFAHHIHYGIDKDFNKNGGTLETLFNINDASEIKKELTNLISLIDKNAKLEILTNAKNEVSEKIKGMQKVIKRDYPGFLRSKKFPEFEKYVKNSDARYLMKYDVVRIKKGFWVKKDIVLTAKNPEIHFPDMPVAFQLYIKLCSLQRKQAKISRRINKMRKYYEKPTELFARFVTGYFLNEDYIRDKAPVTFERFLYLLKKGYYNELKDFFEIFIESSRNN